MFYIIGIFRKTALFVSLALLISLNPLVIYAVLAYLIIVAIHLLAVKISDKKRKLADAYLSALGADVSAPFRHVWLFFLVVTGIHKIKDDSKFHDFIDFLQVLFDFLWTLAMVILFIAVL